jgi:hypothetical protein
MQREKFVGVILFLKTFNAKAQEMAKKPKKYVFLILFKVQEKQRKSAVPNGQNLGRVTQNGSNTNVRGLAICEQTFQVFPQKVFIHCIKKNFLCLFAQKDVIF